MTIHRIPCAFPPQDFVYNDETWEKFYKEQFTKHSAKEGTSVDLSKYKKSIYPYSSYLGFWDHYEGALVDKDEKDSKDISSESQVWTIKTGDTIMGTATMYNQQPNKGKGDN